jgi:hypothetical protein
MPRPGHPVVEYESLVDAVREAQDAIQVDDVDLFQISGPTNVQPEPEPEIASVTSIEEARTKQLEALARRPRSKPRFNPNQPRTIFT